VNQFVVPAPIKQAWSLLADLPRIAPCLPGATVRQLEDGQFEGKVAVIGVLLGAATDAPFTALRP
jgi:carbon monoxide dehydrogenase subunit G